MRYQDERHEEMSQNELLDLERKIHNNEYSDRSILGRDKLRFSLDEFWNIHRKPYHKGAYKTGYRKRRLFELIGVDNISGKKVLDIGCGKGVESVVCAKYGANVWGIDISEEAIRVAQEVARENNIVYRCNFSVQSAHDIKFDDNSFDILLCNAVLHHILKYEGVVKEMCRVVSPEGMVAIGGALRRNPIYNYARNMKRYFTGETVKGDVDIDMKDINRLASMFQDTYFEHYALFSSVKRVFSGSYISSVPLRSILYLTETMDSIISGTGLLKQYGNEIVGILRNKKR